MARERRGAGSGVAELEAILGAQGRLTFSAWLGGAEGPEWDAAHKEWQRLTGRRDPYNHRWPYLYKPEPSGVVML